MENIINNNNNTFKTTIVDYFCNMGVQLSQLLENCTSCIPNADGGEAMSNKIRRHITVNGESRWITATTEQEYAEKLLHESATTTKHNFKDYAERWFNAVCKPSIEEATIETYRRQLDKIIYPVLGCKAIEDISSMDVQQVYNRMGNNVAKETKKKVKMVLNPILDYTVEEGIIKNNVGKSKKIKLIGKTSKPTEPYSIEQMQQIVRNLGKVEDDTDRAFITLMALHPLRQEEVLGLRWGDIKDNRISVVRAVTHPDRNKPIVKATKTGITKNIPMVTGAMEFLRRGKDNEYIVGGNSPCSYQQVRRMCERIQKQIGFSERITPRRFRTTLLTDIYSKTKDIKLVQEVAGHTTPNMTLKYYVKGRIESSESAKAIESLYGVGN